MRSTNYVDTFIEVADDCPVSAAQAPPLTRGLKTSAVLQYEMIIAQPYVFSSDDVLFEVFARRQGLGERERQAARQRFFAKDQACLRASPLPKRYGWGVHHDHEGRVALVAVDSDEYRAMTEDPSLAHLKALRSRRA